MNQIAYFNDDRLTIDEYDPKLHKGKIVCADDHIMIAKKGEKRAHHYAHKAGEGSDDCIRKMGPWHLEWQSRIDNKFLEFRMKKDGKLRIADAVNIFHEFIYVIEFQKSVIPPKEIASREKFYQRTDLLSDIGGPEIKAILIWIFDASQINIEIEKVYGKYICFKIISGSKFMLAAKCTSYYDFGKKDLVKIISIHKPKIKETKFIGELVSMEKLDRDIFKDILIAKPSNRKNKLSVIQGLEKCDALPIDQIQELYFT